MPAPVPSDDKRPSSRLPLLFRAGLAVAALAALLLLVATSNTLLRVGAVLAITSVVLIGLSITLRPDSATGVRQLAEEIDELRAELATVAESAREAVESARRPPVEAASARVRVEEVPPVAAPEVARAGRARVSVPDPVPVDDGGDPPDAPPGGRRRTSDPEEPDRRRPPERGTGRRRAADPDDEESFPDRRDADGWYGEEEPPARPRAASRYAADRPAGSYRGAARPDAPDPRPGTVPGPVGVVRRTETVQVTTRHTIVDGSAPDPGPESGYGRRRWSGAEDQSWSGRENGDGWDDYPPGGEQPAAGRPRGSARPATASRPEAHGDDERGGRGAGADPDGPGRRTSAAGRSQYGDDDRYARGGGPAGGQGWSRQSGREHPGYPPDGGADDWSEVRAGGRWASVREDEHGREVRLGERRAAVHADDDGTELRVEDRWAAVRRPRRGQPDDDGYDRDQPGRAGAAGWSGGRRGGDPERSDRALPAGGVPVPEQWRSAGGERPEEGWSAPAGPGRGRPSGGRRRADDWPEPSSQGRRSADRYGRRSWDDDEIADDRR